MRNVFVTGALAATLLTSVASGAIIADFNAGIGAVADHPYPTPAFNTWYDATSDAFATPAAGTLLDASPSLRINDGGFTNGIYIIYSGVVPADGEYYLQLNMDVVEDAAQLNSIRAYEVGVVVNGAHRTNAATPNDIATVNPADPGSGVGSFTGLTTGNDNALPTQLIQTDSFQATAGANLLIVFSTDVDTGNFDDNSATWGTGGFVLVDNIELVAVPEPSSALSLAAAATLPLLRRRRRA
jgi:hypothetical protein